MLALMADLLVIRPLCDYYISLGEQIIVGEKKLEQNMINITMKEVIEKRFEEYRKFMKKPAKSEEEAAMLLGEIEKLARANEVILADMKPQEGKAHEFYREYVVKIDAEAEMDRMIKFMHQVETSDQLMQVVKAKFSLKQKDATFIRAELTVTRIVML